MVVDTIEISFHLKILKTVRGCFGENVRNSESEYVTFTLCFHSKCLINILYSTIKGQK